MMKVEGDWGYFTPDWGFEFILNRGGYFDQRYSISFCFIYGKLKVNLPFKTRLGEGCDMPQYGYAIHNNTAWLYTGGDFDESLGQCTKNNWKTWDLPFTTWNFDNHWILNKDNDWRVIEKGERSWEIKKTEALTEVHPYRYTLKSGEVQNIIATCTVERRKWKKKWMPLITMSRDCIDVEFSEEVGDRKDSWKGGVTGCGYDLLPDETMKDCLKRMEKERIFK